MTSSIIHSIQQAAASGNLEALKAILIKINPADFSSAEELKGLGILSSELFLIEQAEQLFKQGLVLDPQNAGLLNNLGHIYFLQGRSAQALVQFETAAPLTPNDIPLLYNLGLALEACEKPGEGRVVYERILAKDPNHIDALVRLALIAERDLDQASLMDLAGRAQNLDATHSGVRFVNALILRREKKYAEALAEMEALIPLHPEQAIYHYECAGIYEKQNDFKKAFASFAAGNQLSDKHLKTHDQYNSTVTALKNAYRDIAASGSLQTHPINRQWPIFILGCPRSGTTLLAQMLDAHSQVQSEGELSIIHQTFLEMQADCDKKGSFADFVKYLWLEADPAWIKKWSVRFLERVQNLSASKKGLWVVDKMPDNALALGLIGKLAPGAAIIHLVRDGREVAMSCFRQNFAVYHWHSYDLTEGIHHWVDTHEVVSAGAVLKLNLKEVLYEKLVEDAQGVLADLFGFLGLDWEEECLNFHETQTIARTASYEQVRQKLNRQGLDFCKKNYPEEYGMMTKVAGEKLTKLGYL